MHFQHHAKPNCFRKDPDINMHPFFFALGKILSVEVSEQGRRRGQVGGGEWRPPGTEGSGKLPVPPGEERRWPVARTEPPVPPGEL